MKISEPLDLSPDEIMAKFDVNKDGVLDSKELNNLMEKIVVREGAKSPVEGAKPLVEGARLPVEGAKPPVEGAKPPV